MDQLIASLTKMHIDDPVSEQNLAPTAPTKHILEKAVQHLFHENLKLKQEIELLRSLLVNINKPHIPQWVH